MIRAKAQHGSRKVATWVAQSQKMGHSKFDPEFFSFRKRFDREKKYRLNYIDTVAT